MAGLYVHLPFCSVHCTYCPFAVSTDVGLQDAYAAALEREIGAHAEFDGLDSIYFGGGTPSRMSSANLERVSRSIRKAFDVAADCEFSIEANPEDLTAAAISSWQAMGVNRVSIGVQSFDDGELRTIGRVHDARTARDSVRLAVRTGLRTNLDLIAGLPGQSLESFRRSLDIAVSQGAGHLSLYMLDLDEPTPLGSQVARGAVVVPPDDVVADAYTLAVEQLQAAGLNQYEISNFARSGQECRHNLLYWRRQRYYGFGMAAHSFLNGHRFSNTRNIREYIAAPDNARTFDEALTPVDERRERIFLGLRQTRGLDYDELVAVCGQEGRAWVERGLLEGWLQRTGQAVGFTTAGFLLSSEYISQLF